MTTTTTQIAQIKHIKPVPAPGFEDDGGEDGGDAAGPSRRAAAAKKGAEGGGGGEAEALSDTTEVRVRWYYRPEESAGGRRPFHAVRELLLSDHDDVVPLGSLMGPARVLPLAEFAERVPLERRRLDPTPAARGVGRAGGKGGAAAGGAAAASSSSSARRGAGAGGAPFVDEALPTYFARLMYRPRTWAFVPDRLPVFCTCESAYCPDGPAMICCPGCHEFFHPQVRFFFFLRPSCSGRRRRASRPPLFLFSSHAPNLSP
jgi:hypothetical protein